MLNFLLGTNMCMAPEGGDGGSAGGAAPAAAPPAQAAAALSGGEAPPPAAAPPAAAAPATAPPPPALAFMPEATAEDIAFAQSKGWDKSDNPAQDIFQSYQNLQTLFGADKAGNTFQIPGEGADASDWDTVYNKLGRPEQVDGYSEGHFSGMEEDLSTGLKAKGHELGLSETQLAGLRDWNNESTEAVQTKWEQQAQVEFQQQSDALDTEWGAAKDQNIQLAREATTKMGWTEDQVAAMQMALGYDGVMKLALGIGKGVGEGAYVSQEGGGRGDGLGAVMTPQQAKIEMNKLTTDAEFIKQWTDKSHPKHAEAVARKTQLSKWANPTAQ